MCPFFPSAYTGERVAWLPRHAASRRENASADLRHTPGALEGWRLVDAPDYPGGVAVANDRLPGTLLRYAADYPIPDLDEDSRHLLVPRASASTATRQRQGALGHPGQRQGLSVSVRAPRCSSRRRRSCMT